MHGYVRLDETTTMYEAFNTAFRQATNKDFHVKTEPYAYAQVLPSPPAPMPTPMQFTHACLRAPPKVGLWDAMLTVANGMDRLFAQSIYPKNATEFHQKLMSAMKEQP